MMQNINEQELIRECDWSTLWNESAETDFNRWATDCFEWIKQNIENQEERVHILASMREFIGTREVIQK